MENIAYFKTVKDLITYDKFLNRLVELTDKKYTVKQLTSLINQLNFTLGKIELQYLIIDKNGKQKIIYKNLPYTIDFDKYPCIFVWDGYLLRYCFTAVAIKYK